MMFYKIFTEIYSSQMCEKKLTTITFNLIKVTKKKKNRKNDFQAFSSFWLTSENVAAFSIYSANRL